MTDSSSDRDPVEELAEEFLERFRRGERPALSEYTRKYPDLSEQIRDLFPALVMLEDLRPGTVPESSNAARTSDEGQRLERLGDYRILREVGRGGMGIVYEAEQESLGRHVALKILPTRALLDDRLLQRFQREARAAARLHHTNIVPVFGVGEFDGLHYYVMQFIHGQGLDQVISELIRLREPSQLSAAGQLAEQPPAVSSAESLSVVVARSLLTGVFAVPAEETDSSSSPDPGPKAPSTSPPLLVSLSSPESHRGGQPGRATLSDSGRLYWHSVARIGIQVAEALAYAHSQGTLHRDIKPSNLLLDTQGIVWVTDFGLAKAADSEDLTHSGDVVGTLRYMAPERFQGHADPRSDVYALGLTLYELITLRPAFNQSERSRLLLQVMHEEPPRPRKLNPAVPRDLETVVLKAMARDPAHRYPNAAELAEDLKRFTNDQPIRARPVSEVEKLWRWCQRNPSVALFAGAFLLTLLLGIIGTGWKWHDAEQQRRVADIERAKVQSAERETAVQRDEAMRVRNESQRVLAGVLLDKGIALADQGEVGEGLFWMLGALKEVPQDARELATVIRTNLAAWRDQRHRLRQVLGQPRPVRWCTFGPDGKRLVTASSDGVRCWETATGRAIAPFNHDVEESESRHCTALAVSPDGKMILTGSSAAGGKPGQAERWDAVTGQPLGEPLPHPGPIGSVVFTPDGKQFVTGCTDGIVRLWDITGRLLNDRFVHDKQDINSLAISPDGRTLAVGTGLPGSPYMAGVVQLWDLVSGQRLGRPLAHKAHVRSVAFSPDGKVLASGGYDGLVRLWDAATGQPPAGSHPLKHINPVFVVRFSPDGRRIVTGSMDGIARWWDASNGQLVGTLAVARQPLQDLAFSPDGRTLALASGMLGSGEIHLYQVARDLPRPPVHTVEALLKSPWFADAAFPWFQRQRVSFSPDGKRVLSGDDTGWARLWDATTGQPVDLRNHSAGAGPLRHSWPLVCWTAFSPDGGIFATASRDNSTVGADTHLWEVASSRHLAALPQVNWVSALAFSPDSKVLATGGYDCTVRFWDTATGKRLGSPLPQRDIVLNLAFSPDGKILAVTHSSDYSGAPGTVLWDLASRRQLGQTIPGASHHLRFSPDGSSLLTAAGLTLQLWDPATARPLGPPITEPAVITSVAFRPDGQMLLVATTDGTLRLRELSGKPVGVPMPYPHRVNVAVFSPDPEGRLILAGYADGSARLWDRITQKPVGPPMLHRRPILAAAFTPAPGGVSNSFLTVAEDGIPHLWPVPAPLEDNRDRLTLDLQVRTGLEMGEGQTVVPLSAEAWEQRRQQLARLAGEDTGPSSPVAEVSDRDFHDARARDAEQDGDAFAALWHLNHLIAAQEADKEKGHEVSVGSSSARWLSYARRARVHTNAGQFDRAEADYAQALAFGSPELLLNWYRYRTAECQAGQQWQAALWYLNRVIAATPNNWQLYADRARAHEKLGQTKERQADLAQAVERGADTHFLLQLAGEHAGRGQWDQAEADLVKAGERGPLPLGAWQARALLCLKRGDREGYRHIGARLLEVAGQRPPPQLANSVAWICALGPDAVADYAQVLALAELALSQVPANMKPGVLNTLGALHYRAGRFREAIARLQEGIQVRKGEGVVQDWLFLAMAHDRLGEKAEARSFLAKVLQHKPEAKESPWVGLEVELLRQEAQTLIEGKAKDPKK